MRTQHEILALLAKQKPELEKDFKVRSLALFGSYAREEQQSESDVDILVDVDPSIGLDFVSLAERIEEALGLPVELVSRRAVKPRALKLIEEQLIYV
jgi:hypothetical protein